MKHAVTLTALSSTTEFSLAIDDVELGVSGWVTVRCDNTFSDVLEEPDDGGFGAHAHYDLMLHDAT